MFDVIVISRPGGLDLEHWRRLRRRAPNLRSIEEFLERNPFTKQARLTSTPDSVEVIDGDTCVGQLFWDDARLLAPLELEDHTALLEAVAHEIAEQLEATVDIADSDDLEVGSR